VTRTKIVPGTVTTQYTQNRWFTISEPWLADQSNSGIAKNAATKVAGRKHMVRTAIAFIAVESALDSTAIALDSTAIR
jgi:hypothetical protein